MTNWQRLRVIRSRTKLDYKVENLSFFSLSQVDKLVETKGLDYIDREKAKRHGVQQAEAMYDAQYNQGGYGNYGPPPNYGEYRQGGY